MVINHLLSGMILQVGINRHKSSLPPKSSHKVHMDQVVMNNMTDPSLGPALNTGFSSG